MGAGGAVHMEKFPPVAAVTAMGPLGIVHLPRMWAKALQHATGHLNDDYIVGCGLDRAVSGALGIDMQEALSYIQTAKPTYHEFEAWVVARCGGTVGPDKVRAANEAILGITFDAQMAKEFRAELGLPQESKLDGAANLDTLDDWLQFHRWMTAS